MDCVYVMLLECEGAEIVYLLMLIDEFEMNELVLVLYQ